jgi:hypothetical protein
VLQHGKSQNLCNPPICLPFVVTDKIVAPPRELVFIKRWGRVSCSGVGAVKERDRPVRHGRLFVDAIMLVIPFQFQPHLYSKAAPEICTHGPATRGGGRVCTSKHVNALEQVERAL